MKLNKWAPNNCPWGLKHAQRTVQMSKDLPWSQIWNTSKCRRSEGSFTELSMNSQKQRPVLFIFCIQVCHFLKLVKWIESSERRHVKMKFCECVESSCFVLECRPSSGEQPEWWRCNAVKLIFILTASPPLVMTLSDVSQSSVFLFPGL